MKIADLFDENEKPLEKLLPDSGFCGIFRTIGCVGDSLSSGEFQTLNADGTYRYTDMYEYSWGQFIARAAGSKVYNFSRGGMSAKEYMESFAEGQNFWDPTLACQAYIIALGLNDCKKMPCPLGSIEDIREDYRDNADTFTGHYGAIIQRLKEVQPNAKFFLMTMHKREDPADNALFEQHAALVYQIAERFSNCYVMDFYRYAPVTDAYYHEKFYLHGHLNPCGYIFSAKLIMSYMDYIIRHNIQDFAQVAFIGHEDLLEKDLPEMEET